MRAFTLFITLGVVAVSAQCASSNNFLEDPLVQKWMSDLRSQPSERPAPKSETLVTIQNGTMQGGTATAVGGGRLFTYTGIPYAAPPVGNFRFRAPEQSNGWGDEILDATRRPLACAQFNTSIVAASEDCLFLNVFTTRAANATGAPLPVTVFLHGGGFLVGEAGSYTGSKFLSQPGVLVVPQYRVGVFGFLSTGDSAASGNWGLKDQVQALRWVKENIAAFGGNPNDVTIMGESAGAVSAMMMMISPLAQGLFTKVASMSGTPITEWAVDRTPKRNAERLGGVVGCSNIESTALVNCLRGRPWQELAERYFFFLVEDLRGFKMLMSGTTPVIEANAQGAFLTDDPLTLFTEGPLPQVPVLMGAVQHEGTLILARAYYLTLGPRRLVNDTDYVRDRMLGDLLGTWGVDDSVNGASISQSIALGFLPGGTRDNFTEIQYHVTDMCSVVFMKGPVQRTVDILSRRGLDVYLYSFEHYNEQNSMYSLGFALIRAILGGEVPPMKPGTMHGDDLIYMFDFPFVPSSTDNEFSAIFNTLFNNFATHGNPTPEATSNYPLWPKYNVEDQHYMKLNSTPSVQQDWSLSWRQGMLPSA